MPAFDDSDRFSQEKQVKCAMFKRLDHVGVVVHDIDATLQTYCNQLGFRLLERVEIPEQKVVAAFLDGVNSTIELISPTDTESGTARFLANRGEGTHHVCYEVDDILTTLAELQKAGVRLIDETPRHGVHGLVAFIHPKATNGLMIELLQKSHR